MLYNIYIQKQLDGLALCYVLYVCEDTPHNKQVPVILFAALLY